MIYVTRTFKIIPKRKWQKKYLEELFKEATLFRNWSIFDIKNNLHWQTANKINKIKIDKDKIELKLLSSQMKQNLQKEIMENIIAFKRKKKGKKGLLKQKSFKTSIPLSNQSFKIKNNHLYLQKLKKKHFYLRGIKQIKQLQKKYGEVLIRSGVLLKRPNGYFISIVFGIDKDKFNEVNSKNKINKKIGIDLGINSQITCSNGIKIKINFKFPKRIRKLHKQLSKKNKNSNNRKKYSLLLSKSYEKLINNKKRDINKRICAFLNKYDKIAIQDDDIQSWRKLKFQNKKLQRVGLGMIKRKLFNELNNLVIIDRFEKTSQICSKCGIEQKISLQQRKFKCNDCGNEIDRDINAAINIYKSGFYEDIPVGYGEFTPVEMETSERIFGNNPYILLSHTSMKQEANK